MTVFKQRPVTLSSGSGASSGIREANLAILDHMERLDSTVTSRRAEALSKVFVYLPRTGGLSGWRLKHAIITSLEKERKSQKQVPMRKIADYAVATLRFYGQEKFTLEAEIRTMIMGAKDKAELVRIFQEMRNVEHRWCDAGFLALIASTEKGEIRDILESANGPEKQTLRNLEYALDCVRATRRGDINSVVSSAKQMVMDAHNPIKQYETLSALVDALPFLDAVPRNLDGWEMKKFLLTKFSEIASKSYDDRLAEMNPIKRAFVSYVDTLDPAGPCGSPIQMEKLHAERARNAVNETFPAVMNILVEEAVRIINTPKPANANEAKSTHQ